MRLFSPENLMKKALYLEKLLLEVTKRVRVGLVLVLFRAGLIFELCF